jgi:signal recognition particle GTPase
MLVFCLKMKIIQSGLCKLIKCDAIVEKKLFYNDTEQQSISYSIRIFEKEKFGEVVRRLEENKMRPGLTILLHGYPGTGKTETIYQLAKANKQKHIACRY